MYFGRTPLAGQFTYDEWTSSASSYPTGYPLSVNPGLAQALEVVVGGAVQRPIVDYTIQNQVLMFSPALTDGLSVFVRYLGVQGNMVVVPDESVTPVKLVETILTKDVAGGTDVTLNAAEGANSVYVFTGALTTNINVVVPITIRSFIVSNSTSGAHTLTVKTADGTGIVVAQSKIGTLYCNGANVVDSNSGKALLGSPTGLTSLMYPTLDGGFRDLYRAGFKPSWFNQQWGGSQWGGLPDGSFGSVATGNIQDDTQGVISQGAANYYCAQGFKVSETATFDAVFVKLVKYGDPTYNLTARIYSDTAGSPNAAIGSAATLSMKLVTSKVDGEWYQITGFAVALTAGVQYHLVLSSLTAIDATNYVGWKGTTSNKYPSGSKNIGTSVPAWTPTTSISYCFLIQNPAANSLIQSGGMFDYKLAFNQGNPVNQSRAVSQPLVNFYDGKNCTILHRGTYAVSSNIYDFTYGLDHDRITLTINASGYPVLSIYESDSTLHQVTGTASVASGNHDIAIKIKTEGAGADVAYLEVDGASVGTPLTAQTFTLAKELRDLGTCRLGDGFGIIPAWTVNTDMSVLPSAAGWTWVGTTTEANAMSVSGGKLYQNVKGYGSTQSGYYQRTTTLNNATGWSVSWKARTPSNTNAASKSETTVSIFDGTKIARVTISEYFLSVMDMNSGSTNNFIQLDCKQIENVFTAQGRGSDFYLFANGHLIYDGTGQLLTATANNLIQFGDIDDGASSNADAIWDYVKIYEGGMLLPIATSGSCSEFAHWSGDKSSLLPYAYNAGTPVRIKQLCGVEKNYIGEGVKFTEVRRGVTQNPTSSGGVWTTVTDLEAYSIGSSFELDSLINSSNSLAGASVGMEPTIDGRSPVNMNYQYSQVADYPLSAKNTLNLSVPLGLHKIETKVSPNVGTQTHSLTYRNLTVKSKA